MKKILKHIKELLRSSKVNICKICGWQIQESETAKKLKEHCKDCKCNEK